MIPNSAMAALAKDTTSQITSSSDSRGSSSSMSQDVTLDDGLLLRDLNYPEDLNWEDQLSDDYLTGDKPQDKTVKDYYQSNGSGSGSKYDPPRFDQIQKTQLTLVDDVTSSLVLQSAVESDDEDDEQKTSNVADTNSINSKQLLKIDQARFLVSHVPKVKKQRKKSALFICLTYCKYDSVHRVAKRFGFKEVMDFEDWNLFWTDGCATLSRMMDMKKFQKINHFPGMSEICRKDLLARNMNRMLKSFPKEYNIFPRTWCLPADSADFQLHARRRKNRTYIIKPESSCQGRGIWLTRKVKEISVIERLICQQYISKPFLIDGLKFDFRIYVVVTNIDPFRIYLFKDGLARFATTKYAEPVKSNVANIFMHLTNYAINKSHDDYTVDDEAGNKRRISTVIKWMEKNNYDIKKLWAEIDDVIIKTLISAHSALKQNYKSCFLNHELVPACFDILGFDILLDHKLKPYLLEVNHSPSFHTDTTLDMEIKETLIYDTLHLVNFEAVNRKQFLEEEKRKIMARLTTGRKATEPNSSREDLEKVNSEQLFYEKAHIGNFRCIYPTLDGTDHYKKFFMTSSSLYQETATFKAHTLCSRIQREKILRRKEELEILQKKKKDPVRPESPDNRKPSAKPRIPKIDVTPIARRNTISSHCPGAIALDEEKVRVNALVKREELIRSMGILRLIKDMFGQDQSNTGSESLDFLSSSNELNDIQSEDLETKASESTVSDQTTVITALTSTVVPNFEGIVAEAQSDGANGPPKAPQPASGFPHHIDLPQLAVLNELKDAAAKNLFPPDDRGSDQKTASVASFRSLPTSTGSASNAPESGAEKADPGGQLKPLAGLFVSPMRCISSSLYPFLRYSPVLGHRIARDRQFNRMLSDYRHQHELKEMLSLYRESSASIMNLMDKNGGSAKNQGASGPSAENGAGNRARSVLPKQSKRVVKTAEKPKGNDNLMANNFLAINRLDLRPLNQK